MIYAFVLIQLGPPFRSMRVNKTGAGAGMIAGLTESLVGVILGAKSVKS